MALHNAKDKTFLITGGASGLGAVFVEQFLSLGAKGVAILDIAEEAGKSLTERLNKLYNDKVVFLKCDISKEEDIENAFESVIARFKQIDVIINNAGIMSDASHMWRTSCEVNWQGVVSFTMKGISHMRKDEGGVGGTIVNISSTAALAKFPFVPIYSGSKMAVLHFSQCVAMDPLYDQTNIRVLTMCFGATDTPILHNLEAKSYQPNLGKVLVDFIEANGIQYQKVESAVTGLLNMFENGTPGSIWLAVDNKPAKDITSTINRIFKELEDLTRE